MNNSTGSRPYDRILTLADMKDPGRCFVYISKTNAASSELFKHSMSTQEGVGDVFIFEEPQKVKNTLGSSQTLFIVDECLECYPISGKMQDLVPEVKLSSPPAGETRWFAEHGVTELKFPNAALQRASCTGKFCDRQTIVSSAGQKCGCFYMSKSHPFVIEMEVTLPVGVQFDTRGRVTISNFRSYRTSQLFVDVNSWKQLDANDFYKHRAPIRKAVTEILKYVSQNGGWTYVGWVRTGSVQDSSDIDRNAAENLSSISQAPHISYLCPTNMDIIEAEEFKSKQFKVPST